MKPDVKHCLERAYEEAVRAIRSPDPLLAAAHDALSVEFSLKAAKLLGQQDKITCRSDVQLKARQAK